MEITRKQRQLQLAMAEKVQRTKLVHAKHRGWLAMGMTSIALAGVVAFTGVNKTSTVSADTNSNTSIAQQQNVKWTLRPVADIVAQIQASNKKVYDIKWGDTLSTISEALNQTGITTSVDRLAEINHIANVDLIYAGAKLYLQGNGDNATVTTKDSNGNNQTYNLNPSKSAVATPADKAAAKAATPSTTGTTGVNNASAPATTPSKTGAVGKNNASSPDPANNGTSTPTFPSKPNTPSTPVTKVSITVRALDQDGRVLKTTTLEANVGLTLPISAPSVDGYAIADGNQSTKTIKVGTTNPSVDFTYKRVAKNTNKSVTKNVDEAGNDLGQKVSSQDYHQLSSTTKTAVTTLPNGDTLTTTTTTVTYHKIVRTTKHATVNVDKDGNKLASTDGYTLSKTATTSKDTISANGDITTTVTTTNTYAKTPVVQKATVTVKYVDAETGASIKPTEASTQTVGDTFTATAIRIGGYTLQGNATQSVKVSADGNTLTFSYKKDADNHHTNSYVTKNVDEQGNDLGDKPDTNKYHKLSTSKPAKTGVKTLPNGDTITTYTTTVTYHKIVHTDKSVTKNVDEQGNVLPDKVDTTAYKQMSSSDKKETTTADNGDTTTTDTTTVVYHKIARSTKHVTVNVDEQGNKLDSTNGYDFVNSSDASSDSVAANGDVTTTITTTNVYKKHVVVPTTAKVTVVAKDTDGNTLKTISVDANIGDNYTATAPSIDGYDVQGNNSQTVKVSADGNTITFTYKKHEEVPTTAKVTIVAKDTDGNVLKTTSVDATIGNNYTATAPSIDGYDLQGNDSQTVKVDASGNTITFTYKKHETFNVNRIRDYHITQVNAERARVGNSVMLKANPNNLLIQAAQSRAEEQAKLGKLDDHAGERTNPYIQQYRDTLGSVTENCGQIFMNYSWTNEQISQAIIDQVIDEHDAHTDAMIYQNTNEMGVGIAISGHFLYWVQEFGIEASTLHNSELSQLTFNSSTHSATPSESLRSYLLDQIVIPGNRGIDKTFLPNVKPFLYIGKKIYQTQQDGEDALAAARATNSSLWNQFNQTYVSGINNEHKFIGFIIVGKSTSQVSSIDLTQHPDNLQ